MLTLRKNGWSFKQIAKVTETSINTTLGQMRYATLNTIAQVAETRVREGRRRRFKEGRDGTAQIGKVLFKLPPYQFFVIKMKEFGLQFDQIAQLENVEYGTVYDRWRWARTNLEKCCESYEDYVEVIEYLDSLNTNVGGANWHKPKEKVERPLSLKADWFFNYIRMNGGRTPKQMARIWNDNTGGSKCRSGACKILKKLQERNLLQSVRGIYNIK